MNGKDMGTFVRVCKNENHAGFLAMDENLETTVWNIHRSRLVYIDPDCYTQIQTGMISCVNFQHWICFQILLCHSLDFVLPNLLTYFSYRSRLLQCTAHTFLKFKNIMHQFLALVFYRICKLFNHFTQLRAVNLLNTVN